VATCGNTVLSSVSLSLRRGHHHDDRGCAARTGSDAFPLARLGFVLLAAGGLLVLAVRRRREA
jgi:hypothetical protein